MVRGIVKFFDYHKGYGFIREEGSDKEYFVHISSLIDSISEDDKVEFQLVEGRKGIMAIQVKLI